MNMPRQHLHTDLAIEPSEHDAEDNPSPLNEKNSSVALTRQSHYLLGLLGQRYVQYYPVLASLTGSIKAALMLGHTLYWTRTWLAEHPERDGWFWKKAHEWKEATGLTVDEQRSARAVLTGMRLLQEKKKGMPATLYFRVDLHELGKRLSERHSASFSHWQWDSTTMIRSLLGRPVVFYKPLADVAGSVTAGLYLSHLLAAQRTALLRREINPRGYFHHEIQRAQSGLVIGPKALRNARIRLRAINVLTETWTHGLQPKLLSYVHLDMLSELLKASIGHSSNKPLMQVIDSQRMADSAIPVSGKGQPWNGGTVHSRVAHSPKQGLPKAQIKFQEKGNSNKGVNTIQNELLQQPPEMVSTVISTGKLSSGSSGESNGIKASVAEGKEMILPSGITELERRAALKIVAPVQEDLRQIVLDEWAGQLANPNKKIVNSIGYLRSIVASAKADSFVPTVALVIAESRAKQEAIKAQHKAFEQRLNATLRASGDEPSSSGNRETELAAIRKIVGARSKCSSNGV